VIKLGTSFYLNHLLFVDDVLLFCDGSRREVNKPKEILDLYVIASRMEINMHKSSISCNGMEDDQVRRIM
jgi:hypothetical protein